MSALEALRKQAEQRAKVEDPQVVRAKAIEALNKEMRDVSQYLAQIGGEISSVKPQAGMPYEVLFFGKIPVMLSNAWVDSRPRKVDGLDCCECVSMRYQVNPESPAKATLLAGDIAQTEQTLKMLGAEYQMTVEQKNDFGQARKASFTIKGKILNEIEILADYTNLAVNVELINLWKPGKRRHRIPAASFKDIGDEVARYILGVDKDFEARLK
ncbi:MAG: hypothetical protein JOZ85_03425 [Betaproteobacteria bacterium]|nr:hypothetical protein [Betaproteobacteria bacterium]